MQLSIFRLETIHPKDLFGAGKMPSAEAVSVDIETGYALAVGHGPKLDFMV